MEFVRWFRNRSRNPWKYTEIYTAIRTNMATRYTQTILGIYVKPFTNHTNVTENCHKTELDL